MKNFYNFFLKKKIKIYKSIFNNYKTIFCIIRKKFYIFSYEELLRQKIILYLILVKGYNISNISVEEFLYIKNQIYKIDILVKKNNYPYIIIECKSPKIKINNNNLNQILQYGNILNNKYYLLTNSIDHIIFKIKKTKLIFIKNFPKYKDI
ncbi:MAG: type I restriction enzyme HsdR N-terminal domain-containing protein [Candidatus Shikimatogenerans bostrichidophilus]|nr:MAG: type I restriction enzyme HsdR N-terminal domain-containing protein [Candidatus Shikimatogenerans bostrichidophilus]